MTRARLIAAGAVLSMLAVVAPAFAGGAGAASEQAPTFIVTLRSGEPREVAADHARQYGAQVDFVYEHALRGYAARVSEGQIGALARDGRVARVERDQVVHAVETPQTDPTWGLDRVDQRPPALDGTYTYAATGSGVTAYIIDTGIRTSHTDFSGRASLGFDAFPAAPATDGDCNGHGTHVAGTVGGSTYGVAKAVTLVAVRVLDCNGSGTWSGVIAGIDWVTEHAVQPAVANMSLGGGASDSVDSAVRKSIAAGISYAVAAGNGNRGGKQQDACGYSPARVIEAMTIGATTRSDAKTSWSNYGSCVDWFAPGYQITSAWHTTNTATNTISGTSMAAPHVAGAAALVLQGATASSPEQVRNELYRRTTKGVVTSSSTANNHLLHTLAAYDDSDQPTGDGGTTDSGYSISVACDKTRCSFDASPDLTTATWDFGDGGAGSGDPATHDYSEVEDTHIVTLIDGPSKSELATATVTCKKKGPFIRCG